MRGLKGKRAIVTGAASGIGWATAQRFLEEGVAVLAVDRNAMSGLDTPALTVDVSAAHAPELIMATAHAKLGGLDILFNNAGISEFSMFEDHDADVWTRTMAINFESVARISRAAIPLLKQSAAPRIINTASTLSSFAVNGLSAYVAAKHAVLGLTRSMATELGQYGITVNAVQPGAIDTGISRPAFEADPAFRTMWETRSALGRIGRPDEVAALVAFLASEDASFMSGHGYFVDGAVCQQM